MQLALLIAASVLSAPGQQAVKPDILIYWMPGNVPGVRAEPEVAIWKSGQVLWRDPAPVWGRTDGKWSLRKGTFYEGKVATEKIEAAIASIKKATGLKVKEWHYMIVDSHSTNMI